MQTRAPTGPQSPAAVANRVFSSVSRQGSNPPQAGDLRDVNGEGVFSTQALGKGARCLQTERGGSPPSVPDCKRLGSRRMPGSSSAPRGLTACQAAFPLNCKISDKK